MKVANPWWRGAGLALMPATDTADAQHEGKRGLSPIILGGAGDDLIDGDYGDDTLIGGAGADSYVFGWEAVNYWRENGTDTIVEAPGETSTLRLQRGMSLDLFRAERMNDDLRFKVRGAEHSVVIKDYFSGNQQWSIQSADGSVTSMSDFLARPDADSGDPLRQAWNDFAFAARWEWFRGHERPGDDWEMLADGRYYRSSASVDIGVKVMRDLAGDWQRRIMQESRRWQDGEQRLSAANDKAWRTAA